MNDAKILKVIAIIMLVVSIVFTYVAIGMLQHYSGLRVDGVVSLPALDFGIVLLLLVFSVGICCGLLFVIFINTDAGDQMLEVKRS